MVFQDVPAMFSSQKGPHRSQIVSKILEKKPPLTGAALPPGPVSSWDVLKWQTSIELLQKPLPIYKNEAAICTAAFVQWDYILCSGVASNRDRFQILQEWSLT